MSSENPLGKYNKCISGLTLEQIENMSDEEILSLTIERPGHPGQRGFLLHPKYFQSEEHLSNTLKALLDRLGRVKTKA